MQLALPLLAPRDSSVRTISVRGRLYPVVIARHRLARRYLLRVCADGTLRLTVPRGAAIADGLTFAESQGEWIEQEQFRQQQRHQPWRDGSVIWFRGREEVLRVAGRQANVGDEVVPLDVPDADLRDVIGAHFVALASRELPRRCLELAGVHGVDVTRVSVRNQKSRWGACSSRRAITLNWRLVQMPVSVSDYVVLHELMHVRQPNHSRRFWREVASVCPDWREGERWLRRHGRELL